MMNITRRMCWCPSWWKPLQIRKFYLHNVGGFTQHSSLLPLGMIHQLILPSMPAKKTLAPLWVITTLPHNYYLLCLFLLIKKKTGYFEWLPNEIFQVIIHYLNLSDLAKLAQVNTTWKLIR